MKVRFAIVVLAVLVTACKPGQVFGPDTAKMTVGITSLMPGDVLTPYINFEPYSPALTDEVPTYRYRPRIQTRRWYSARGVESGQVYVSVWSENFARQSRVKQRTAYTDQVVSFEFRESDFR